jgi:hypothetical protein
VSVLLLVAAVAFATAIWLAATVALAGLMQVPLKTITYGVGPQLAEFPLDGRRTFEVRAFPFASNLTFVPRAEARAGERLFADLDPWRKIALALAGCAGCFLVASLVLGVDQGLSATLATWGELLRPVTQFNDAAAQWQPIVDAANGQSLASLSALACAKVSAFNLLPLGGLSGWIVVCLLFGWPLDRLPPAADTYARLSLVALLGLGALWAFSAVEYVARSLGWLA